VGVGQFGRGLYWGVGCRAIAGGRGHHTRRGLYWGVGCRAITGASTGSLGVEQSGRGLYWGVGCRAIAGGRMMTTSPDLVCVRLGNTKHHHGTARTCVPSRPLQRRVHRKGGVRQGLARMLPALHAAMRCLALSACLVFFVRCVCVIKLSVLSPAPQRRLQRLPRRWERTPQCRCIRCSIQPTA